MSRRVLAALAAAGWLAGCVSILDVDADDHQDLSDVVCACVDAPRALCEAVLERATGSAEVEQRLLDCAAADPRCAPLDTCIAEVVQGEEGDRCSVSDAPDRVKLRCKAPNECDPEQGRCRPASVCLPLASSCTPGDSCCDGRCEGNTCCSAQNGPCSTPADCCDTAVCLEGRCIQCAERGDGCNPTFPCCGSGDCPVTEICL